MFTFFISSFLDNPYESDFYFVSWNLLIVIIVSFVIGISVSSREIDYQNEIEKKKKKRRKPKDSKWYIMMISQIVIMGILFILTYLSSGFYTDLVILAFLWFIAILSEVTKENVLEKIWIDD
jgi:UPF0716 family protein affecting phage T7 exclusion